MITISNYREKIEEIAIDNLHETLRDGHNFIIKASKNFTNWDFYKKPAYKEIVDDYLDKLNDFHSVKKGNKATLIKDFYNTLDKYQKAGIDNGELPDDKLRLAETLGITIQDLQAYDRSVRKVSKPKETPPDRKPKEKKEKKETKDVHPHLVESLKEEIKFIKRYVGLHNKTKSSNAILNFIKGLQKSILQRLIRKESSLAKEISQIQDVLVETYNSMGREIKMKIDDNDLPKLVAIAGGENVYPSINLIKRFIGLTGKTLESKPIAALVKAIENARTKKKVLEDDPYLDKIEAILKILKKTKSGDRIEVSKAELNGLSGIINGCSCSKGLGNIYDTRDKPPMEHNKRTYIQSSSPSKVPSGGVMTAKQMANRKYETLQFDYPWNDFIGNPAKNFQFMVHGEPNAGKTTLLLKFTKYLAENFYKRVLYVTSEEYDASTMTMKVNDLLIPQPENFDFARSLNDVDIRDYDLIVLDSINDLGLTLEDFKRMKIENPDCAFILVLQVTKAGHFRGGKNWEHEVQIAARIDKGTITVYRNRFGRIHNEPLNFFEIE